MASDHKLGLALSGGGFRASFFHIGVLAQMAELGLLRQVEVISTVSGGSIIGAHYYLHVKRLLESKQDADITDQDYVTIVKYIEDFFFAAVQENIRMRTFRNPLKNLRMVSRKYSRSDRIGELYDEYFYRPFFGSNRTEAVQMRELKILPPGEPKFSPETGNPHRRAKVPVLLINATTLNTGHNWRFTAVWMGEPPYADDVTKEIDKNLRLRRAYYDRIQHTGQHNFELGHAVAASAGVPGLFPPLAVSNLYQDLQVQLVDGGVHDNLGTQGLRDEKYEKRPCTHLIVSDASGWLEDEREPQTPTIPTFMRSSDILMDRVREEELCQLYNADPKQSRMAFMHLRKGLEADDLSPIDPGRKLSFSAPKPERAPGFSSKDFGVCPQVQDRLSRIRTDLDSFTEVEAYSLMLDGYNMTGFEITPGRTPEIAAICRQDPHRTGSWHFLQVKDLMLSPTPEYIRQLKIAHENLFKVFRLSPVLAGAALLALVLVGGTPLVLTRHLWWPPVVEFLSSTVTLWHLLVIGLLFVGGILFPQLDIVRRYLQTPSEFLTRLVVRAVLPALGSVFVLIHLYVFDPLFIRLGTLKRVR